ncbi:unnamed protein product [Arabidopsis lyrata]|uniref:uncharacterized protein At4g37920, chloroplastic n=1 Tax=Arabidopsis lyrata subsp. lyrata TaxID=81972 RepID=UPI000A29E4DE|nr:uncharacterized protein At4g37920, chloroplastic [Arabidopsis lyrata subsp. lyrata]CAH8254546.1 unnamed protein product [Arabidopsis lyrata]|eukprot:XP_020868905.1 uncharacterized protein At4g37920, chloroplastic [Arabidopsis lyrata subsp. lyrata]
MVSVLFQSSCSCSLSNFPSVKFGARVVSPLYFAGNHVHVTSGGLPIGKGSLLNFKSERPQRFVISAVVDDKSVVAKEEKKDGGTADSGSEVVVDNQRMIKVCDKLIEVFMVDKPTPSDWRRLLAFSKEWDSIRPHFYRRCQERADSEDNPEMKHKVHRLARKLKEVDEDIQRHNELLNVIKRTPPADIGELVARHRKDFTNEFFEHLHTVAESYYDNLDEQNALASLGKLSIAAVQAYDTSTESIDALNAAELKLQDIINSPSLDAACRKIDSLAEKNQLDSALVLMITKAWSAAKESNMMKEEVKDILYHLYVTARGNLQRLMPKEVRILKYLLSIEDPQEQMSALQDAFTPGDELEGTDVDYLYTTPEHLQSLMKTVLEAYHFSREGSLVKEAKDLMHPELIAKIEQLKKLVEKKYM